MSCSKKPRWVEQVGGWITCHCVISCFRPVLNIFQCVAIVSDQSVCPAGVEVQLLLSSRIKEFNREVAANLGELKEKHCRDAKYQSCKENYNDASDIVRGFPCLTRGFNLFLHTHNCGKSIIFKPLVWHFQWYRLSNSWDMEDVCSPIASKYWYKASPHNH